MAIKITIRQADVAQRMKDYAEKRASKIVERFPKIEDVHMIINSQRHLFEAEVVVQVKGQVAVGNKEQAYNIRSAIDMASARVETQLRKNRKKIVSIHTRP